MNQINYKIFGKDTSYHQETPALLCSIIESLRATRQRVKIVLGDPKTGREWGDVETGYIGRSTGNIKIPRVIPNSRSTGGGALLDNCIIRIEPSNKRIKGIIYQAQF